MIFNLPFASQPMTSKRRLRNMLCSVGYRRMQRATTGLGRMLVTGVVVSELAMNSCSLNQYVISLTFILNKLWINKSIVVLLYHKIITIFWEISLYSVAFFICFQICYWTLCYIKIFQVEKCLPFLEIFHFFYDVRQLHS